MIFRQQEVGERVQDNSLYTSERGLEPVLPQGDEGREITKRDAYFVPVEVSVDQDAAAKAALDAWNLLEAGEKWPAPISEAVLRAGVPQLLAQIEALKAPRVIDVDAAVKVMVGEMGEGFDRLLRPERRESWLKEVALSIVEAGLPGLMAQIEQLESKAATRLESLKAMTERAAEFERRLSACKTQSDEYLRETHRWSENVRLSEKDSDRTAFTLTRTQNELLSLTEKLACVTKERDALTQKAEDDHYDHLETLEKRDL